MPLEDPDSIDIMGQSKDGRPLLVITDAGLSSSDEERVDKLLAKLKTYAWFVTSPDYLEKFPGCEPGDAIIEVTCATEPSERMRQVGGISLRGERACRIEVRYRVVPSRLG